MSRLTRNGTAKSVSRNQILRRVREQGKFFPVQLTMDRIGKLTLNSRLLSGHLGFVAGTLRGSLSPSAMVRWVCNSRDPVLCAQGTLTSQCGHNCLISYWYTAANVARFFFIRVFKEVI